MWLTWGALSLLAVHGLLEVTGTVDFNSLMWVVAAATIVGAVLADRAIARLRLESQPLRVPAQR